MKSQMCISGKQIMILLFVSGTGDFETPVYNTENIMMLKNRQITQQTQTEVNDWVSPVCLFLLLLTVFRDCK